MKKLLIILKLIFDNLIVDTILGLCALGLLIWWIVDDTQNFTGFLLIMVSYVSFNIINKIKVILKAEENGR